MENASTAPSTATTQVTQKGSQSMEPHFNTGAVACGKMKRGYGEDPVALATQEQVRTLKAILKKTVHCPTAIMSIGTCPIPYLWSHTLGTLVGHVIKDME